MYTNSTYFILNLFMKIGVGLENRDTKTITEIAVITVGIYVSGFFLLIIITQIHGAFQANNVFRVDFELRAKELMVS